jgi:hypothetical protein
MIDMSKPYKSDEPVKRAKMKKAEEQYKFEEEEEDEEEEEEEEEKEVENYSPGNYFTRRIMLLFLCVGAVFTYSYIKDLINSDPSSILFPLIGVICLGVGGLMLYKRIKSKKSIL